MGRYEAFKHSDIASLLAVVNGLPQGSQVISVYALGCEHCAWVYIPRQEEIPFSDSSNDISNFKKRKAK